MMGPFANYGDDEDEDRENLLKMLGGEVDDFAGEQLEDPSKPPAGAGGVTLEISIKPHGAESDMPEKPGENEEEEEHDPIAHILGMCGGGCPK